MEKETHPHGHAHAHAHTHRVAFLFFSEKNRVANYTAGLNADSIVPPTNKYCKALDRSRCYTVLQTNATNKVGNGDTMHETAIFGIVPQIRLIILICRIVRMRRVSPKDEECFFY